MFTYAIEIFGVNEALGDAAADLLLQCWVLVETVLITRLKTIKHVPTIGSWRVRIGNKISEALKNLSCDAAPRQYSVLLSRCMKMQALTNDAKPILRVLHNQPTTSCQSAMRI